MKTDLHRAVIRLVARRKSIPLEQLLIPIARDEKVDVEQVTVAIWDLHDEGIVAYGTDGIVRATPRTEIVVSGMTTMGITGLRYYDAQPASIIFFIIAAMRDPKMEVNRSSIGEPSTSFDAPQ